MSLSGTIIFSFRSSGNTHIWSLELSSGALLQLTQGSSFNTFPRFSPDGTKIAYLSTAEDSITSLWIMNRNGGAAERLTESLHVEHPSWSPDGKKILFTGNKDNPDEVEVCIYDLESKSYEVLFNRKGVETEPELSPDGEKVIFAAVDPESTIPFSNRDTDIWERNIKTGSERKICSHPARDYGPVYSPDGSKIAFISHRNGRTEEEMLEKLKEVQKITLEGNLESIDKAISELKSLEMDSEICVVDARGDVVKELTKNRGADTQVRWSPCGEYLVYVSTEPGSASVLKIINASNGEQIDFKMNLEPLEEAQGVDSHMTMNTSFFWKLVPDFIEKPFKAKSLLSVFWGDMNFPDWAK